MSPFVRKKRFCRCFDGASYFKPRGIPLDALTINDLALDELEAMRLCDYEELSQEDAAVKMNISTSTLQRLLYSGRKKIVDAICHSKALKISKHEDITEYSDKANVKKSDIGRRHRKRNRNIDSTITND
jgi:uncharacterized protein